MPFPKLSELENKPIRTFTALMAIGHFSVISLTSNRLLATFPPPTTCFFPPSGYFSLLTGAAYFKGHSLSRYTLVLVNLCFGSDGRYNTVLYQLVSTSWDQASYSPGGLSIFYSPSFFVFISLPTSFLAMPFYPLVHGFVILLHSPDPQIHISVAEFFPRLWRLPSIPLYPA